MDGANMTFNNMAGSSVHAQGVFIEGNVPVDERIKVLLAENSRLREKVRLLEQGLREEFARQGKKFPSFYK